MDDRPNGAPALEPDRSPPAGRSAGRRRDPRCFACAAVLLVLAGVMLGTVLDYGMTADEPVQNRYGNRLVRWYATLGSDRSAVEQHDTWLYGGLFELVVQGAHAVSPLSLYETRHVVNVLFGLVGLAAASWMGRQLAGSLGGLLSLLFLALTPTFYGHAFANPKDIPFASLFALAAAAVLHVERRLPDPGWPAIVGTGAAIGLAAGVRVAGIVLFGYAAVLWIGRLWMRRAEAAPPAADDPAAGAATRPRGGARLALGLVVVVATGWAVMVAFWPYAQLDPIGNPFRAFRAFSRFWEGMAVLYDGELVRSGDVSRFSIPTLLVLTLPETYAVALVTGVFVVGRVLRESRSFRASLDRSWHALSVAALAAGPVAWAVVFDTPLYNGSRHFLFVLPPLAALAGASVAAWLRGTAPRAAKCAVAAALAIAAALTASDMVALHPYQTVYFNRSLAGGVARAATRYETDYWCSTYREGVEWIVEHYSSPDRKERVRVAGHSVLTQVSYDLRRTRERRRLFRAVTIHDRPHLVLATTALRDHERTPGRVVHVVERQGAPLLYVFEVHAPP